MRHKLPYEHDTTKQAASLDDGVSCKQTMTCDDDSFRYRGKERLERSVSQAGEADHENVLRNTVSPYYGEYD